MHVSAMETRLKKRWKPLLTGSFAVQKLVGMFCTFCISCFRMRKKFQTNCIDCASNYDNLVVSQLSMDFRFKLVQDPSYVMVIPVPGILFQGL